MFTRREIVRLMVNHARECLALDRGTQGDRFVDGVLTGICVGLSCLEANDELREVETLQEELRADAAREVPEESVRLNFDQETVVKLSMRQAESHFADAKAGSRLAVGALMGIRSCLMFMDADEEAKRISNMFTELTTSSTGSES